MYKYVGGRQGNPIEIETDNGLKGKILTKSRLLIKDRQDVNTVGSISYWEKKKCLLLRCKNMWYNFSKYITHGVETFQESNFYLVISHSFDYE